jgi:hypothetical protein
VAAGIHTEAVTDTDAVSADVLTGVVDCALTLIFSDGRSDTAGEDCSIAAGIAAGMDAGVRGGEIRAE